MSSKKSRGRPPKEGAPFMKALTVRFGEKLLTDIESELALRRDEPDRGAFIRELCFLGVQELRRRRKREEDEQ